MLEEHNDDIYVDDSDDDLDHFRSEEMDKDEELRALMEFVFGDSSDEEALYTCMHMCIIIFYY